MGGTMPAGWLGDCYNNYKRILAERLLGDNLLAQEDVFEWKISARFTMGYESFMVYDVLLLCSTKKWALSASSKAGF